MADSTGKLWSLISYAENITAYYELIDADGDNVVSKFEVDGVVYNETTTSTGIKRTTNTTLSIGTHTYELFVKPASGGAYVSMGSLTITTTNTPGIPTINTMPNVSGQSGDAFNVGMVVSSPDPNYYDCDISWNAQSGNADNAWVSGVSGDSDPERIGQFSIPSDGVGNWYVTATNTSGSANSNTFSITTSPITETPRQIEIGQAIYSVETPRQVEVGQNVTTIIETPRQVEVGQSIYSVETARQIELGQAVSSIETPRQIEVGQFVYITEIPRQIELGQSVSQVETPRQVELGQNVGAKGLQFNNPDVWTNINYIPGNDLPGALEIGFISPLETHVGKVLQAVFIKDASEALQLTEAGVKALGVESVTFQMGSTTVVPVDVSSGDYYLFDGTYPMNADTNTVTVETRLNADALDFSIAIQYYENGTVYVSSIRVYVLANEIYSTENPRKIALGLDVVTTETPRQIEIGQNVVNQLVSMPSPGNVGAGWPQRSRFSL